jgi:hypothetical protein
MTSWYILGPPFVFMHCLHLTQGNVACCRSFLFGHPALGHPSRHVPRTKNPNYLEMSWHFNPQYRWESLDYFDSPNYLPVRQITTLLVPQSHSRQDWMTCLKFLIRMSKKSRRIVSACRSCIVCLVSPNAKKQHGAVWWLIVHFCCW